MVFFCASCWKPRRGRRPKSIPHYKVVNRSECPLLEACWNQNWDAVLRRVEIRPQEAMTQTPAGRTALHLATMPGANAPPIVIERLVEANPHAVIVHDSHKHGGTPLHFLVGSKHRNSIHLVQLLVDTAIRVERDMQLVDPVVIVAHELLWDYKLLQSLRVDAYSPLFLASRKSASAETLQILVQSQKQTYWIAPWTGGETVQTMQLLHGSGYASPLFELWRIVQGDFENLDRMTIRRMKEVAQLVLDNNTDTKIPIAFKDEPEAVHSWVKILVLLRPHTTYSTLMHTVACLYFHSDPLLELVCKVVPELALQSDKNDYLPIHSLLIHQNRNVVPNFMRELVDCQSHCLHVPCNDLYPFALAAAQDASLDTIHHMLRASPSVLQMQRAT